MTEHGLFTSSTAFGTDRSWEIDRVAHQGWRRIVSGIWDHSTIDIVAVDADGTCSLVRA